MTSDEERPPSDDPYAAPAPARLDSGPVLTEVAEEQYLRAVVGAKADYYLEKWAPLLEGWGRGAGFNWAAFIFSGLWLPYRKMYTVTLIFYAAMLAETIVEEVLFLGILGRSETPAGLDRIVGLLAAGICGAYGNRWYLSHARRVASDVRAQEFAEDTVFAVLSKRGGTSVGSSLVCFLSFVGAVFALYFVVELLFF